MSEESKYGAAEYLCYEVIRQMEDRGQQVPETSFNKLCTLVYDEIEDTEEVDLPHQWYQYGYEVNRRYLNDDFLVNIRNAEWQRPGTQISIEGISQDTFDVADDLKKSIKSVASRYAKKFQNTYGTAVIKDYSYEIQAPNEFIQVMNEFRDELDSLDAEGAATRDEHVPGVDISFTDATEVEVGTTDIDSSDVDDDRINEYLRRLGQTFPEDTYLTMQSEFYQWKTLCKQLIRYDLYGELRQFQSSFWNIFSRVELRIHHSENIPHRQRQRWIDEREEHITQFKDEMEAKRRVIMKYRNPTNKLDSVSAAYDEAVEKINKRTGQ